jgi:hypothetical protein
VWHAEAIVEDEIEEGLADTEFRSVLFWVNLARKNKNDEPSAQLKIHVVAETRSMPPVDTCPHT